MERIAASEYRLWYKGRRAIVTGGLGFIGSALSRELVDCGAEVWIVDNELSGSGADRLNISDIVDTVNVKIVDIAESTDLVEVISRSDCIFNLAGFTNHMEAFEDPEKDYWANAMSHYWFLKICAKAKFRGIITYTGSRSQYGRNRAERINEDEPQHPIDLHGVHKMVGEAYHYLSGSLYGLNTVSIRLVNTYGPRQPFLKRNYGLVADFVNSAFNDETIEIFGKGSRFRELIYIDDAVDILLRVGTRTDCAGMAFNAGGFPCSMDILARTVVESCGKGRITYVPFPETVERIEVGDVLLDISRARMELGWVPTIEPAEGLKRTVEYFQRHYGEDRGDDLQM